MGDADDVFRSQPHGGRRHVFEDLGMMGEKNVAGARLIAGQPGHTKVIDQPCRALFEPTDELAAHSDKRQ